MEHHFSDRFVGERLTQAREAREMTMSVLGELAGITPAAISQFEKGKSTPSPETETKLSQSLKVPISFFRRPIVDEEPPVTHFRSLCATRQSTRKRVLVQLQWLKDILVFCERFVDLPILDLPDFVFSEDPTEITDEEIEAAAKNLRVYWMLDNRPISSVAWLLENKGIIVVRNTLSSETIDAFSCWISSLQRPVIVLGSDKGYSCRSRFDAAHELGHVILHRYVPKHLRESKTMLKLLESQANRFASAFLLPKETFLQSFRTATLNEFVRIKQVWLVSVKAMIYRSMDLGVISKDRAQQLFKSYSARGWNNGEPLDDELRLEQPQIMKEAIRLIVDEGILPRAEIMSYLDYYLEDVARLCGISPDYLVDEPGVVRHIRDCG